MLCSRHSICSSGPTCSKGCPEFSSSYSVLSYLHSSQQLILQAAEPLILT